METEPPIYLREEFGNPGSKLGDAVYSDKRSSEFPSEWFAKVENDGKKPGICISKSGVAIAISDLRSTTPRKSSASAVKFMWHYMTAVKVTLHRDWISFSRTIGLNGDEITLADIFDQPTEDGELRGGDGPREMDENDVNKYLLAITGVYRYHSTRNETYRDILKTTIKRSYDALQGNGPDLASFLLNNAHFINDKNYLKCIAGIDMLLQEFQEHPYSNIKVGTVNSRMRDSAVAVATSYFLALFGMNVRKLSGWIWTRKCGRELVRVVNNHQEIERIGSYSQHAVDLHLVSRSPYSCQENPDLNFFIHVVGAGIGQIRSLNAAYIVPTSQQQLIHAAIVMTYAHRTVFASEPAFTTTAPEAGENDIQDALNLAVEPTNLSGIDWYLFVKSAGRIPNHIVEFVHNIWRDIKDPRDGTIGAFLKSYPPPVAMEVDA